MLRLSLIATVFIVLAAAAAYVLYLQNKADRMEADNEQLTQGIETAVSANQSYLDAMAIMAEEAKVRNTVIESRDRTQRNIQRQLRDTERRLRDASRAPEIVTVERECLHSDMPDDIAGILRETPGKGGGQNASTRTHLPSCCTLFGAGTDPVHGSDVFGHSSVREDVAIANPFITRRSLLDPGIL